jgi:hypothetical protein
MAIVNKQYFFVGTTDAALEEFVDAINGAVVTSSPVNITVQADSSLLDALDEFMASIGWMPGTRSIGDLGWFGTGIDGALVFDGVSTVLGIVPAGNVYVMDNDIFASNLTVDAGVRLVTAGYRIYVAGTLTIAATGFVDNSGTNAVGQTNGVGGAAANLLGGGDGGDTIVTSKEGVAVAFYPTRNVGPGAGGAGGDDGAFLGQPGGTAIPQIGFGTYMIGTMALGDSVSGGAGGGGAGSSDGAPGAGGGGGGVVLISAQHIVASANAILAKGGDGANGTSVSAGGGGGGGGGAVIIITNDPAAPVVDVAGGSGGTATGTGTPGVAGSDGVLIAISPVFGPL